MLDTLVRKVLPDSVRSSVGLWALKQASRATPTLRAYIRAAHGYDASKISLVAPNRASYKYADAEILMPRDGIGSCFEVFDESVYDRCGVSEGDVVVDVGSYVGMFAVKMATKGAIVVAFEPDPDNYKYLCHNTMKMIRVYPIECAISNAVGTGRLSTQSLSANHCLTDDTEHSVKVVVETLDSILSKSGVREVDLLKIDAEGGEIEALEGAKETLKHTKNVAVAVYSKNKLNRWATVGILGSAGFVVEQREGLRSYIYGTRY